MKIFEAYGNEKYNIKLLPREILDIMWNKRWIKKLR
jgi:hypothetical protein